MPAIPFLLLLLGLHSFARATGNDPGEFSFRATLPLTTKQQERLREIVATDAEAAALFAVLKSEAEAKIERHPKPLRVIHYEGLVNTDPRRIESVASLREMDDVAVLHQYWQVTEDARAAATLRLFITQWAQTYEPTGNDVNENKFYPLFAAYHDLRSSFEPADRLLIDEWLVKIGKLHEEAVLSSEHFTNRYTKHVRLLGMFGRILNRADWQEMAYKGVKTFVTEGLRPDGTSLDLERRDSLTYHTSGLRPVLELAVLAGPNGSALYEWTSPSGSSLKKSVDYVVPYADGSKTREEWVNTKVDLDRRRAAEGIEAYRPGRLYEPKNALRLLEEASFFDHSLIPLVLRLHESKAKRYASWTMVLNDACR